MKDFRHLLCWAAVFLPTLWATGQNIPLGTWRIHASFNNIARVTADDAHVYGASANAIMKFAREDKSLTVISKLDGLHGGTITAIQADAGTKQLIVAYDDGLIDILWNNTLKTLDPLRQSTITGSRRINHILVQGSLAYLSTDFGVLVLDLPRAEVKETWRDLGTTGGTLQINAAAIRDDSIFLATANGVLAGSTRSNLLDFRNWRRFENGELSAAARAVAIYQGTLYAAVDTQGLYRYNAGSWVKESAFAGSTFRALTATPDALLVIENEKIWRFTVAEEPAQITDALIQQPLTIIEDRGKYWIGDGLNGLVSNDTGTFQQYLANGPAGPPASRLTYAGGVLYAVSGGYTASRQPLNHAGIINKFENGTWTSTTATLPDITDVAVDAHTSTVYAASFQGGLEINQGGTIKVLTSGNSPLKSDGSAVKITALAPATEGLWVANYGTSTPLHLLKPDNTWESVTAPFTGARYPIDLALDPFGYVWAVLDPEVDGGILVYDLATGGSEYITETAGSGALPNRNVFTAVTDRDGLVWTGTATGVSYFFDPTNDASRPIFENRFLLRDDQVTSIAIDGGNRKWMGTGRGVWLFNPTGEALVHHFTTANSPLLSDNIVDIEINAQTGEVFFATDKGLVSFRGDATEGTAVFQQVKIFPNPVTPAFMGTVAISGLATDAVVKITDISGKMVWQTQAQGGTASWNVQDYHGKRAATGIYLVFASTPDGSENAVGKIAVVD
ncbi:type IX secretion system anionic LPS delivery protein PorZ [Dawidia soli]|uniref:T9SS type A sorting domain-containing protein n=1 Tax=Dawidia soli TaxID=2782352 RepID=A0AAP2DE07_9BACT|nr:T9SS type A sorting domain-containing protein [Dawidia soli]MBT1690013.1 T9SS type A sorting domain-containing protein [Dawidia soli]